MTVKRPKQKARAPRRRKKRPFKAHAIAVATIKNSCMTMLLPRKIPSMNRFLQPRGNLFAHADTMAWENMLRKMSIVEDDKSLEFPARHRMRLEIDRLAPRPQYFLDPTNLRGGIKKLEDALVRLHYLRDDSESWIDGPHVFNKLSSDGKYWAVIRLSYSHE